jgi:hypothetical protein
VDAVYEVKLKQGNTMIIPTGWIHAVVSAKAQEKRPLHCLIQLTVYTNGLACLWRQLPPLAQHRDPAGIAPHRDRYQGAQEVPLPNVHYALCVCILSQAMV